MDVTSTRGAWMGLITTLASGGVIGLSTANALVALTGLIPGALALLASFLGAHGVATTAEPKVTPICDPRVLVDGQLVTLVPAEPKTTGTPSTP